MWSINRIFCAIASGVMIQLTPIQALAACGQNQSLNTTTSACECNPGFYINKANTDCITAQDVAIEARTGIRGEIGSKDVYSMSGISPAQKTADLARVNADQSGQFVNSNPGLGLAGMGTTKQDFCKTYIPDPQNPDSRMDAECKAVRDLSGNQVSNYIASSGFNKNDAGFGGPAVKQALAQPYTQVGLDPNTLQPKATGGQCVTTQQTTQPTYTDGVCTRTAAPTTTRCTKRVATSVVSERFCNASGTGFSQGFAWGGNEPKDGTGAIVSLAANNYSISYTCAPPDPVTLESTQIVATMRLLTNAAGAECGGASFYDKSIVFTPGKSTNPVRLEMRCDHDYDPPFLGFGGADHYYSSYILAWYDGASDTVYVQDTDMVANGAVQTGVAYSINEVGPDYAVGSCPTGQGVIPTVTDSLYKCTTQKNSWGKSSIRCSTASAAIIQPARCGAPGSQLPIPSSISKSSASGTWDWNSSLYIWTCPAGAYFNASICPTGSYSGDLIGCANACETPAPCPSGFKNFSYQRSAGSGYTHVCQEVQTSLRDYAPFDHYQGGAGIRSKLVETVIDSTPSCDTLQQQNVNSGPVGAGSYPAKLSTVYSCPNSTWNLWMSVAPGGAAAGSSPYCSYDPPAYQSKSSTSYKCTNGNLVAGASGQECHIQPPTYTARYTDIYSCAAGDVVAGACPNGGNKIGETCQYQSTSATPSYNCAAGQTPLGSLCYIDISLATNNDVVDNVNIFAPTSTSYTCASGILTGTECRPAGQSVTCNHQPPDYPAQETMHYKCSTTYSTGNYPLTYAQTLPDTIKVGACTPAQITKQSTLLRNICPSANISVTGYPFNGLYLYSWIEVNGRCELQLPDYASAPICSTNYSWANANNRCEWQMPDYASTAWRDCPLAGYTYNAANDTCTQVPAPYPATLCPSAAQGYTYNAATGSCFKVPAAYAAF